MRRALLLFPSTLLVLAGCWPFGGGGGSGAIGPNDLVLCVTNDLAGYGNATARASTIRFDVQPGSTSCRRIPAIDPGINLTATTIGGGAAGPLTLTEPLTSSTGCWRWRLGPGQSDSLTPIDCADVPSVTGSAPWPPSRGGPELARSYPRYDV